MIGEDILYIGTDDTALDLFEGQYPIPNGITYNTHVILDEKTAVISTVCEGTIGDFIDNLKSVLGGRKPDYLVMSHLEPDHSAALKVFLEEYPDVTVVATAKAFQMLPEFLDTDVKNTLTVKEGDKLSLGRHILTFIMAPMVHWPEVMMEYDEADKILFSADAFGRFGLMDNEETWDDEARRYYINIVGKYGAQVQAVLKKAASLDIERICPLHGPDLTGDALAHALDLYQTWSLYEPEKDGVLVAYASIYGHTAEAARIIADMLENSGEEVRVMDLARCDMSEAVAQAFRYDRMILAASSHDAGLMPFMESFISHLKSKNYQKRKVGLIENGCWAPSAGRVMKDMLSTFKEITVIDPVVTLNGIIRESDRAKLKELAEAMQ